MYRREFIGTAGGAASVGLAGCLDGFSSGDSAGTSIRTIEVESSISAAVFRWGLEQELWTDRGIDLSFETAPFGQYNRQIVDGEADIGAPSTVAQLEFASRGEALTFVGPQQNMFNRMFARADDGTIDHPTDLGDKTLGLPAALSSTTSTVHRVLIEDEHGFDIVEDTADTRAAEPPALWEFLQDGDLDAISEFSGFTIKGIADESVKTIFDPHALWRQRTDTGIPTTAFTVRPDWLADNEGVVDDFLAGWSATLESFASNTREALEAFGADAGITSDAATQAVIDLLDDDVVFGPARYNGELADAHWQFFELLAEHDVVELGDRDEMFTTTDALQG